MDDTDNFSFNITKLLIKIRLDLEEEFYGGNKKKSFLWAKVLQIMKEEKPDFEMTREQISRKFLNLLTSYRRIKHRNNVMGRITTSWEFYEQFDEVYGSRHAMVSSPFEHLQTSLSVSCDVSNMLPDDSDSNDCSTPSEPYREDHYASAKKRRKISNETLDFLKEEAQKKQQRHNEILELERRKLEMEDKKIKIMMGLKEILQKLVEK